MPPNRIVSCLLSCSLLMTAELSAQTPGVADSSILGEAARNSIRQYQQFISRGAPLYTGPQYVDYDRKLYEGHVFLYDPSFVPGSVLFDNILYENVPVKYDLYRDVLVVKDASGAFGFTPDLEKIQSFTLRDHSFIKLGRDANNVLLAGNRFYEILYKGNNITLLKKENKRINEELSAAAGVRRTVVSTTDYYVKKGNTYYLFNRKRHILDALRDKESETREFLRRQSDAAGSDPEKDMIQLVTYYDSIRK